MLNIDAINQILRRVEMHMADFNPNPMWLGGYFEVLEEVGIAEKHRKLYAYWVR